MGWSGYSLPLTRLAAPMSEAAVDATLRDVLPDYIGSVAPGSSWARTARGWLDFPSLIELHLPGDPPSAGPLTDLTFWFYETVAWPQRIARHWLAHIVRNERRFALRELMANHGYGLAADARLADVTCGFVVEGERVGEVTASGVIWQDGDLPAVPDAELQPATLEEVRLVRATGVCRCSACR